MKYRLKEIIGSGSYGVVKEVEDENGNSYALKEITITSNLILKYINQEISLLQNLDHQNIVKLVESYRENQKYCLVMEMCKGGDLEAHLKTNKSISEHLVRKFSKNLVSALIYLQNMNIMHRDIKVSNIFLTDSDINVADVKIGDFGFSKSLGPSLAQTQIGTPLYMAPEIFSSKKYSFKADVWSLGLVIYEIITGSPLFICFNLADLIEKQKKELEFDSNLSEEAKEVISAMVRYDPDERPSFEQLLQFRFFNTESFQIPNSIKGNSIEDSKNPYKKQFISQGMKCTLSLRLDDNIQIIEKCISIGESFRKRGICEVFPLFLAYSFECSKKNTIIFEKYKMSVWNEEYCKAFKEKNAKLRKQINDYGVEININASNYKQDFNLNSSVVRVIQSLPEFEFDDRQFLIKLCKFFDVKNEFVEDSLYESYL